jgi:hypothetical protein
MILRLLLHGSVNFDFSQQTFLSIQTLLHIFLAKNYAVTTLEDIVSVVRIWACPARIQRTPSLAQFAN